MANKFHHGYTICFLLNFINQCVYLCLSDDSSVLVVFLINIILVLIQKSYSLFEFHVDIQYTYNYKHKILGTISTHSI